MKRLLLIGVPLVTVALLVGFVLVALKEPEQRPPPREVVERTKSRVTRGAYLAKHVLACIGCHSKRDWNRLGGPIVGHPGAGGTCFTETWGMPGRVCPPNLTSDKSSGLGSWTDGEIMRAIREGVGRHGQALFPMMPYRAYRDLSDEDTRAVVAYLRTLKRRTQRGEKSQIAFPASYFVKFVPKPLFSPVKTPSRKNGVEYGKYLATIAGCRTCHTPTDDDKAPLSGKDFSGGYEFESPFGTIYSPNITFHETGLKGWTLDHFVKRFSHFRDDEAVVEVNPRDNTPMPWLEYAAMSDRDLQAIYEYLKSVPPVDHAVTVRPQG
jgi:mono/diheme cytochrome c family protein